MGRIAKDRRAPLLAAGFEQTWRRYSRLLCLSGFGMIAWTNELHLLGIVCFMTFWIVGWLMRKPPRFWRNWMGHTVMFLGLSLIVIGFIGLRQVFVSVLYLLLLLGLFKCFTLKSPRDYMHMIVITFLMLLACSAIMVSVNYIFFMFLYLIFLVINLRMLAQARDASRAGDANWRTRPAPPRLLRRGVAGAMIVMALTLVIFLIIPHRPKSSIHAINWRSPLSQPQTITGFSGELDIRPINHITPDDTIVMYAYVRWDHGLDRPLPASLRLRGAVLDAFDGRRWISNAKTLETRPADDGMVEVLRKKTGEAVLIQQIDQDMTASKKLFGQPEIQGYHFPRFSRPNLALDPDSGALCLIPDPMQTEPYRRLEYTVYSSAPREFTEIDKVPAHPPGASAKTPGLGQSFRNVLLTAAGLGSADPGGAGSTEMTREERLHYVVLPSYHETQTVRKIARNVLGGISSHEKKTRALLEWFNSNFTYSISPETPPGAHPIEAFLSTTHKGHCEYFATAMVMLLRAQGVPSRIVTGYYPTDFNSNFNLFTVRRSDAHAWVEVWLKGRGWVTVDPTPPSRRGRASFGGNVSIFWVRQISRIRNTWREYIFNYNQAGRLRLIWGLKGLPGIRQLLEIDWRSKLRSMRGRFDLSEKLGQWGRHHSLMTDLLSAFVAPLIVIAALGMAWLFHRSSLHRREIMKFQRSSVDFMNLCLARLKRRGVHRGQGQTFGELLHIADPDIDAGQLSWLIDLYNRVRFGGYHPTRRELIEARRIVRQMN